MNTVFIFTNRQQMLGAKIAKFALEKHRRDPASFEVRIIEVEKIPALRDFEGTRYLFGRDDTHRTYTLRDLQSFTLTRFMAPELMDYQGRAIGIDPDIFACADVTALFSFDLEGRALAACPKKKDWDSSVMVMDSAKLAHWKVSDILADIKNDRRAYMSIMTLEHEEVTPLPREWNSLDILTKETKMLHTTNRLTQPWKTGLPIDFTRNRHPKLFGLLPREPLLKLLGKYPGRYQPHPDKKIERFFFTLLKEAINAGAVSETEIKENIAKKYLRQDTLEVMKQI